MKMYLFAVLIFAAPAWGNVKPGVYTGVDKSGDACRFELGEAWYEDNLMHPLAERQPVMNVKFAHKVMSEVIWNLSHKQTVNTETGHARFEHSSFQQVIPFRSEGLFGAAVMELEIDETERPEGHLPKRLIYFEDHYRDPSKSVRVECALDALP